MIPIHLVTNLLYTTRKGRKVKKKSRKYMIIFVIELKAPFLPAEMNGNLTQIGLSRCRNGMKFHANIVHYR